jgi:hypothetical protein
MPEILEQTQTPGFPQQTEIYYPSSTEDKEIIYPEQREDDIGETSIHISLIANFLNILKLFFKERDEVFLSANMNLYYEGKNPKEVIEVKSLLIILALVILSVVSVLGQNTTEKVSVCTDETVRKISTRGIEIGDTKDDIINLFASTDEERQRIRNSASRHNKANLGYEFFGITPNQNLNQINERFDGIAGYTFSFLDNRLIGFTVSYDKPKWKSAEQFADEMAEMFSLPAVKNWRNQSIGMIDIQCGNYRLLAQTDLEIARSSFGVFYERIDQILEQRKKKAEDEQREKDLKTFKP